jgi:carbon monoxide dehydrogenase subunit G
MKIQNEIEVSASPDDLFEVLADVERVAPLLPGATLEGKEDDDTYVGTVKVKVGPIAVSYRGSIYFQELDHDARRAVMRASGREINGQGSTEATITATVTGSDSTSVLTMDTDMEVRGKVAQFGRGAIGNVSQKILGQFARNLEAQVLAGGKQDEGQPEGRSEGAARSEKERSDAASAHRPNAAAPAAEDSLDLLSVVGTPALRRAAPAAVGLVLGLLIGNLLGAHRTSRVYREALKLLSYGPVYPPQGSSGFNTGRRR